MISSNVLKTLLPFWQHLSSKEREEIAGNISLNKYIANQSIHNGHNDCSDILLLQKGTLRAFMLSEDGREITLFRMSPGEACVLSASCILNPITFDIHISAETKAEILQINTEYFQTLTDSNVYVENYIYKVAMKRFSDVMWVMEQVLFMSIDKRLAIYLLNEKNEDNEVHSTHIQIARNLGTAREVVSRMLEYFESEGCVKLSRGYIKIINIKALKALTL